MQGKRHIKYVKFQIFVVYCLSNKSHEEISQLSTYDLCINTVLTNPEFSATSIALIHRACPQISN